LEGIAMVPSAVHHTGDVRRIVHRLRPSRHQLVVAMAVEVVTTLLGFPCVVRVVIGAAASLPVGLFDRT